MNTAPSNPGAEEIAGDFEAANDEVISFVETCTDAQWTMMVTGENWPVGVVMHHIAVGHLQMMDWLGCARRGDEISKTAAEIDADNEAHARRYAHVTRTATVDELRRQGAALASFIRGLSADELHTFGPGDGMVVTAEQLAPISARHSRGHLADARRTLESGTV